MVLVSVVIPVYNLENYIANCLNSIINQSLRDIEIVIVNDGSSDKSLDIINSAAKRDSRIVVINKENGGVSSARNVGIKAAKGQFVICIDGDDWVEREYVKEMYQFCMDNNLDMAISNWAVNINGKDSTEVDTIAKDDEIMSNKEYLRRFFMGQAWQNGSGNKLFRRSLFTDNQIWYPEHIKFGEDLATILRLGYCAKSIGKKNKAYYHYIRRNASASMNARLVDQANDIKRVYSILQRFFSTDKDLSDMLLKFKAIKLADYFIYSQSAYNSQKSIEYKDLEREYISLNNQLNINYPTLRLNIYSKIMRICPSEVMLSVLQRLNNLAIILKKLKI